MDQGENNKVKKEEKFAFLLGLSVGIATVSLVGLLVVGGLFVFGSGFNKQQKALEDTQKIADTEKNSAGQAVNNPTAPNNNAGVLLSAESVNFKSQLIDGAWTRGDKDAPVVIEEYSDIQCPYCARHHETLKDILDQYPDEVLWVYKHFPLDSIHPYAREAGEAAECAGDQEMFWEYLDTLYVNQKSINSNIFEKVAQKLDLNMPEFNTCLDSGKYSDKVASDLSEGRSRGVRGTPGNFVNGVELKGAVPIDQVMAAIDSALEE